MSRIAVPAITSAIGATAEVYAQVKKAAGGIPNLFVALGALSPEVVKAFLNAEGVLASRQTTGGFTMLKSLIPAVALASALAAPAVAFAQSNGPVTRAQVRAELVQLEKAGYHVGDDHTTYPAKIQAAEAKVAAQNAAASGYGGVVSGSSEAGRPAVSKADWNATYSHH